MPEQLDNPLDGRRATAAAQPTDGEWRIAGMLGAGILVESNNCVGICVVYGPGTTREGVANAHSIAAVPAMLAALRNAEREMRAMRAACGAGLLTDQHIHQAQAAIAAAEGRAS